MGYLTDYNASKGIKTNTTASGGGYLQQYNANPPKTAIKQTTTVSNSNNKQIASKTVITIPNPKNEFQKIGDWLVSLVTPKKNISETIIPNGTKLNQSKTNIPTNTSLNLAGTPQPIKLLPNQKKLTSEQMMQINPPPNIKKQESIFPETEKKIKELGIDPANLKANPKNAITDAWNAIKPLLEEYQKTHPIVGLNLPVLNFKGSPAEIAGAEMKRISTEAGVLFSPLTALFTVGNNIPIIGSATKLIEVALSAVTEGTTKITDKIVDKLPLSSKDKEAIRQPLGELASLVVLIGSGALSSKGLIRKKTELVKKYGEEEGTFIINKAKEIDNIKKEEIKSKQTKTERTPQEIIDDVISNKMENTPEGQALLKTALEAKKQGKNINIESKSYVTIVDHKTGIVEAKEIPQGKLEEFKNVIDTGKEGQVGIAGKRIDNKTYHITSGTIKKSVKKTGIASLDEIPTLSKQPEIVKSKVEIKTSSPVDKTFESRVYKRMKEEHSQLQDTLDYNPINLKTDAKKAVKLIEKDKEKAYRVAMGIEKSSDVTSTAVNIALSEKALQDGNNVLFSKLIKNRSLEQTRRGQEIVSERGSISDNSTSRYVKELISARLDKLGKKYLSEVENMAKKTTNKEKSIKILDREVAKAQKKIQNKQLDINEAQKLIDKLAC